MVHDLAMLPGGKRGIGSGFTTDVWGAFCPVVGILFATLISSTVDKLWARQQALRLTLIEESRLLSSLTELLFQADLADAAQASREAAEREVAAYQEVAVAHETAAGDLGRPDHDGVSTASVPLRTSPAVWDWQERQAGPQERPLHAGHEAAGRAEAMGRGQEDVPAVHRSAPAGRRPKPPEPDPAASYRCIARHLHTLSYLVWGSQTRKEREGSAERLADRLLGPRRGSEAAYAAEVAMISGGEGVDPLADLLRLHPPSMGHPAPTRTAWAHVNAEARDAIQSLTRARGERLAVMESRPPRVHWVVLSFTGTSLVLGFAVVSAATRPATNAVSRLLFTALTSALLAVMRLLVDLAEPFDGGGYTLAVKNTAGALLAPTRRRLVLALARRAGGGARGTPRRLRPAGRSSG